MSCLAGVLGWIALATLFGLAFAFSPLRLTTSTSAVAWVAALGVVVYSWWRGARPASVAVARPTPVQLLVSLGFAAFSLRAFLSVIFVQDDSVRVLSPNNLGDICLHLTQINFLADRPAFWPGNPIYVFDKLHYPLGINLFNAELKLLGVEPNLGIILVALLGSALTLAAILQFNGAFGVAAFLFNGGLVGFTILHTLVWKDYQADVAWKSIPLAMFVTQRGLLYALPVGLLLLSYWRSLFFGEQPQPPVRLPFWTECLLYATLPLFHLHTFLFLSWFLLCWFLFGKGAWRPHLLRLGLTSFLPASVLVYFVTGFEKRSTLGWHPGWMAQPEEPAWRFWLINFGFFLPLSVALLIYLMVPGSQADRETRRLLRLFAFPAAAVFVACALFKFAPWEWDNTKLLCWAYLVLMFCLWRAFLVRWPLWLRTIPLVLLFFSGFVSLVGGLLSHPEGYEIGVASEWDAVDAALKVTPPDAVFAGYPTYNHPVLVTGHRMVMGFPGHVWSHGLDYVTVEKDVTALMLGQPEWRQTAQRLHADYLFWGNFEQEEYGQSGRPWERECPVIAQGDWGKVFDLRTPH
ncbi:MAG: hypothetical protein JO069_12365 [Verrucomicrobia bacterium]|nr:hypothetical protein [Verrucomicrobiota bacterium]